MELIDRSSSAMSGRSDSCSRAAISASSRCSSEDHPARVLGVNTDFVLDADNVLRVV